MRFKLIADHRKFFSQEKQIELEDVFKPEAIEALSGLVDQILGQKMRKLIETEPPHNLFKVGRDLWRDHPDIKHFVCHRTIGHLAGQLYDPPLLQLAFTQVFRTTEQTGFSLLPPSSLQEISCIQPLAGAALIRLKGKAHHSPLLPKKRENLVFFAPDLLIPWEIFFQEPHQSYLLIAFAPAKALYLLEKRDLHTHDLKKLGYVFGDRLKGELHPILWDRKMN